MCKISFMLMFSDASLIFEIKITYKSIHHEKH